MVWFRLVVGGAAHNETEPDDSKTKDHSRSRPWGQWIDDSCETDSRVYNAAGVDDSFDQQS
jgi:hypothetical protein